MKSFDPSKQLNADQRLEQEILPKLRDRISNDQRAKDLRVTTDRQNALERRQSRKLARQKREAEKEESHLKIFADFAEGLEEEPIGSESLVGENVESGVMKDMGLSTVGLMKSKPMESHESANRKEFPKHKGNGRRNSCECVVS